MSVCETSGIETTLLMNHSPETVRVQTGHRDWHSSKAPCNSFIILLYYQTNIIFVLLLIDECGVCIFMSVCLCVWYLTARTHAYSHIRTWFTPNCRALNEEEKHMLHHLLQPYARPYNIRPKHTSRAYASTAHVCVLSRQTDKMCSKCTKNIVLYLYIVKIILYLDFYV